MPLSSLAFRMPGAFYTVPTSIFIRTLSITGIRPTSELFTTSLAPTGDYRQLAYFYAMVSFFTQVTKSQTDLQHLYYARRASIRAQCELIGSIYEKSLVRKDITGAIASDAAAAAKAKKEAAKDGSAESNGKGDSKAKKEAAEAAKDKAVESADVGKIVSLIATDSTQVSNVALMVTVSCSFPFQPFPLLYVY